MTNFLRFTVSEIEILVCRFQPTFDRTLKDLAENFKFIVQLSIGILIKNGKHFLF